MFYIYAYIDPRTNLPFYIGKGKDDRKFDHLNENSSKKENKEKYKIIAELKSLGMSPIIKELESINETRKSIADSTNSEMCINPVQDSTAEQKRKMLEDIYNNAFAKVRVDGLLSNSFEYSSIYFSEPL